MNYYNEHDPKAAAWLRELIKEGHIAPGEVDERDIRLVRPSDLDGFTQCHFFAGIGGWSLALRLAGAGITDMTQPIEAAQTYSAICVRDARTILEMEMVCYSEGIGPDSKELLATIAKQHPEMVVEFPCLDWPQRFRHKASTERA